MNLKQLFNRPLLRIPNKLTIILLVIALIGFADATYLTLKHYMGEIPPCSIIGGCEEVLTSSYSVILGIPVALGGAIFYLVILMGLFFYLESKNTTVLKWTLLFTILGLIFTLWFLYLQIFTIGSYCLYCLVSAGTSILLSLISAYILKKYSDNSNDNFTLKYI